MELQSQWTLKKDGDREQVRETERESVQRHAKHLTSEHHRDQFDFTTSSSAKSYSERIKNMSVIQLLFSLRGHSDISTGQSYLNVHIGNPFSCRKPRSSVWLSTSSTWRITFTSPYKMFFFSLYQNYFFCYYILEKMLRIKPSRFEMSTKVKSLSSNQLQFI